MRTRFAPSPTGLLHLGHAYAALVARDLAHQHDGEFLLRMEDIDTTRVRATYYDSIQEDLQWLGIEWSQPIIKQTDRLNAYTAALSKLQEIGAVYPCFCTRREITTELSNILHAPHGPEGAHYPGTCRNLSKSEITRNIQNGLTPSWRLHTNYLKKNLPKLQFQDQQYGKISVDLDLLGDVILARKDIGTSYHIAVVVDDAWQNISHVTRGEDLLHSTHIHRVLQALLNYPSPEYLHHPLLCNDEGIRLAKRNNAYALQHYRAQGMNVAEVLKLLPSSHFM